MVSSFWLKFDANTIRFFGTPAKNDITTCYISVVASDGIE
jgi:hypothetical protein